MGLQPALEEQQSVLRQHGTELNQEVLNTMDVLHRNITEALRINPPLIMLMRQVKKSFAVTTSTGKTYVVPKVGVQATVSTTHSMTEPSWVALSSPRTHQSCCVRPEHLHEAVSQAQLPPVALLVSYSHSSCCAQFARKVYVHHRRR